MALSIRPQIAQIFTDYEIAEEAKVGRRVQFFRHRHNTANQTYLAKPDPPLGEAEGETKILCSQGWQNFGIASRI
jgi:hypothetical protein